MVQNYILALDLLLSIGRLWGDVAMVQHYIPSLRCLILDRVALWRCGDGAKLSTQPRDRVALRRSSG